jgi:hypothetical protein
MLKVLVLKGQQAPPAPLEKLGGQLVQLVQLVQPVQLVQLVQLVLRVLLV